MKRTLGAMLSAAACLLALTAGTSVADHAIPTATATPAQTPADPNVLGPDGLATVRIGDQRAELERTRGMVQGPGDCAPRLPEQPALSPVFDNDSLVLLWADPPLHTPEGISVGSPVRDLEAAYPDGERLTAPDQTLQYDGLLVTSGPHAYLFLHDQSHVQKLIAGSAEHAELLFEEQFGTC